MLGVALAPMPYGYYTFLRIALCVLLVLILLAHLERGGRVWPVVCGTLLVLYNPLVKIHMSRDAHEVWNVVTLAALVVSAVVLWRSHQAKGG